MWQVALAVVGALGCWEPSGVSGAPGLPAWTPKRRGDQGRTRRVKRSGGQNYGIIGL